MAVCPCMHMLRAGNKMASVCIFCRTYITCRWGIAADAHDGSDIGNAQAVLFCAGTKTRRVAGPQGRDMESRARGKGDEWARTGRKREVGAGRQGMPGGRSLGVRLLDYCVSQPSRTSGKTARGRQRGGQRASQCAGRFSNGGVHPAAGATAGRARS
ncbi:hypothetical protein OBBRIDRAFT_534308 [Obba rivulosa]|uniref:Uncharacterized protein n=1 Tax=Obba rivulosa TaxID=1052685 RepID=A0A8E2J659_9APHY|nr:hypothetical protein OBBRIDRAFT_534308 [Obba rivulosa]